VSQCEQTGVERLRACGSAKQNNDATLGVGVGGREGASHQYGIGSARTHGVTLYVKRDTADMENEQKT
jgi:hypothetical protein